MNIHLVEHGIREEISDIRAHVCVRAKLLYIFRTEAVQRLIETKGFREVPVKTGDIITSRGYVIPVTKIPDVITLSILPFIMKEANFLESDNSTERGRKAEYVVMRFIREGWFPVKLPALPERVTDIDLQRRGVDIIFGLRPMVQVKCDWDGGGIGRPGCTGNLYIETAECNPYKKY